MSAAVTSGTGAGLPLEGLLTIDLSQGVAGPHAGLLMAQNGADVIKVEPPEGDWSRRLGGTVGGTSAYGVALNRGKRSIVLDLKQPDAQEAVLKLCSRADVVIEAFRPGVAERLGFGYEALREGNPGVIYASVTGFGRVGPMKDRPGTDTVLQAFTGMMNRNRGTLDDIPHRVPRTPLDLATGLYAFQAIAVALFARSRGAGGTRIDCSILHTATALGAVGLIESAMGKGGRDQPSSPVGTFRTADGWLSVSIITDAQWRRFAAAIERLDLPKDQRFATGPDRLANDRELMAILQDVFPTRTSMDWVETLARSDLLAERVRTYEGFLNEAQVAETGIVSWVDDPSLGRIPAVAPHGAACGAFPPLAPLVGSHTEEILLSFGLTRWADGQRHIAGG